jgi:KGK domain
MNDRFESLESGEVISVQHDTIVLGGHRTFRVGELNEAIESHLKQAIENWTEENSAWFTDRGLDCEALRFGSKGWQKGRIRLCLEFCPDEPSLPLHSTSSSSLPTGVASPEMPNIAPPPPPAMSATSPIAHTDDNIVHAVAIDDSVHSQSPTEPMSIALPLAGMTAMGPIAATAIASPDTATAPVIPHFTDTTLELEEFADLSMSHGSLDEFAFEFENNRGVMSPNGMMELDLTDLSLDSLDFAEQDLLSLEQQGVSDRADEFINLQDIGRSENSGMLIDEVWNEIDRGSWTGSN